MAIFDPNKAKSSTSSSNETPVAIPENDAEISSAIPESSDVGDNSLTTEEQAANTLDNIFGSAVDATARPSNPKKVDFGSKTVEVGGMKLQMPSTVVNDSDFGAYTEEGFLQPIAAFKHHGVKRFNVGRHTFQNHILQIFTEEDLADFLLCWQGLQGPDKVNITQYDWEAAARVNKPVSDMIARGAQATKNIKDPKQVA